MFTLIIVVFLDLHMNPQVTGRTFDKINDCEAAAHTYLTALVGLLLIGDA